MEPTNLRPPLRANDGYVTMTERVCREHQTKSGRTCKTRYPGLHATVHLDSKQLGKPLLWSLVEVEITAELDGAGSQLLEAVIRRFDGTMTELCGLMLGQKIRIRGYDIYALWTAGETREHGEGVQKVLEEGTTDPPLRPGAKVIH